MSAKRRLLTLLFLFPLLTGCEMVYDLLEIPEPKKKAAAAEAEGRAVGSACRQAGRSLEDCYRLNPGSLKAAVFAGWREMNDYMLENNMEVVPSLIPLPGEMPARLRPQPGPAAPPTSAPQAPASAPAT